MDILTRTKEALAVIARMARDRKVPSPEARDTIEALALTVAHEIDNFQATMKKGSNDNDRTATDRRDL